jgi:hypothetical protein
MVWAAVCGWSLLCNIATCFDFNLRHLVRIAGVNWSQSISLKWTLFTVVPLSEQCSKIDPCACQKYQQFSFLNSQNCNGCFLYIFWRLGPSDISSENAFKKRHLR